MTLTQVQKLDALTTLRFFAAAMIVVHHSSGNFGIPHGVAGRFLLDQAVSFFFVLSGFILTYVYPKLETWEARGKFWLARFGRVWPAHVTTFVLLWVVLQKPSHFPTGVSKWWLAGMNLTMVQAWVPVWNIFFSYNSVSWSISTEVGFYLLFPLLIWKWERTWWWKILAALGLVVVMIQMCHWLAVPVSPESNWVARVDGMMYIHPLARVFEFTVGMGTALLYRKTVARVHASTHRQSSADEARQSARMHWRIVLMTLVEAVVVGVVVASMYYTREIVAWFARWSGTGIPGTTWAVHGPLCCVSFAAMIYVMAVQGGAISRVLGVRAGVLLGEISYTVYLLHWIMIMFYTYWGRSFEAYPGWVVYGFFWAILLLLAWLVWAGIERPLRVWIVGLWPRGEGKKVVKSGKTEAPEFWRMVFAPAWQGLLVGAMGLAVLLVPVGVGLARGTKTRVDFAEAVAVAKRGVQEVRGARFGESFELLGAELGAAGNGGRELKLAWRCDREARLKYIVGVHFVDESGKILGQMDFAQDRGQGRVMAGAVWVDTVKVAAERLAGAKRVGLVLYEVGVGSEVVDRGPRDWGGHRLLVVVEGVETAER